MGERGPRELVRSGWELLHPSCRLPGQRCRRSLQGREREPSGLVRQRNHDVGSPGQCLDQRPLRRREVFEPVREHRPAVPRLELGRHPLGGIAALAVAVPTLQLVELGAICAQELGQLSVEILRLDEPCLELGDRCAERLRVAGEP